MLLYVLSLLLYTLQLIVKDLNKALYGLLSLFLTDVLFYLILLQNFFIALFR